MGSVQSIMITGIRLVSDSNQKNQKRSSQVMSKFSETHTIKLSNWDLLVKALIRPPKQQYKLSELGSTLLNFKGTVYQHKEFKISHSNKVIELTFYEPVDCKCKYVVLYLHGNSSSRLQALTLLPGLPSTYGLASFDFLGCGLDSEPFISLGVNQSDQIETVVKDLQAREYKVILWGRSMGASSALKYGGTFITVADSPFSSMKRICKQTAVAKRPDYVPNCVISCLFPCVFYKLRSDVKKAANFDLKDLNIQKSVREMDPNKVVVFLVANGDSLIPGSHSQRLYQAFPGNEKRIWKFEGNHNTKRPDAVLIQVFDYIQKVVEQQYRLSKLYQESPASDQGIVVKSES